jgi:two-component system, chemotaxis family, response regulator WspF
VRIAIVNDLPLAMEALRRVVTSEKQHQIAWIAYDGAEAVDKCAADTPDLVLMDLIMPVMDGVEATKRIMENSPCAVLVVTATVTGNASKVFDAMGHGALDAVNTPVLGLTGSVQGGSVLLSKIQTIGKLIGKPLPRIGRFSKEQSFRFSSDGSTNRARSLVAIAASTGGPLVIAKLLRNLPKDFAASVIVVQHVDAEFAPGLADWLQTETSRPVRLIQPNDRPEDYGILLAATNDHLILTPARSLHYSPEPKDYPYRPSADVFFRSLAEHWTGSGAAVLLTGMGRDGAEGLLTLRQNNWLTIAQNRQTSIVYGMPKAAAELNAAEKVLPDHEIGQALTEWIHDAKTQRRQEIGE